MQQCQKFDKMSLWMNNFMSGGSLELFNLLLALVLQLEFYIKALFAFLLCSQLIGLSLSKPSHWVSNIKLFHWLLIKKPSHALSLFLFPKIKLLHYLNLDKGIVPRPVVDISTPACLHTYLWMAFRHLVRHSSLIRAKKTYLGKKLLTSKFFWQPRKYFRNGDTSREKSVMNHDLYFPPPSAYKYDHRRYFASLKKIRQRHDLASEAKKYQLKKMNKNINAPRRNKSEKFPKEDLVSHQEEYDPYIIVVLNQL